MLTLRFAERGDSGFVPLCGLWKVQGDCEILQSFECLQMFTAAFKVCVCVARLEEFDRKLFKGLTPSMVSNRFGMVWGDIEANQERKISFFAANAV